MRCAMQPPVASTSAAAAAGMRLPVLGVAVDALDHTSAAQRLIDWAHAGESRSVCLCNVHAVVTAVDDPLFADALRQADLVLPDGAPVAWMQRRLGAASQRRVAGPDLMANTLGLAAATGVPVYLYGGMPETLEALCRRLRERWPALRIAGSASPPFREPTAAEIAADVAAIHASGARLVWVGLGCPKQERWMAARRGELHAVTVGVGAAFEFLSGRTARAPRWMQRAGLEWLHRLATEPRRLGPRYLVTNTRFVFGALRQLLR